MEPLNQNKIDPASTFPTAPIGALFDVLNGATPKSDNIDFWDGDIPWVTPADLGKQRSRSISSGERSISEAGFQSCGTQMVPDDAIILSIRAPIGHIAVTLNSMCFNQGCRGLIPRRALNVVFAYWALQSVRPILERAGQGTTFMELTRNRLRSVHLPFPDLPTQRQIADFLDRETARIDLLIEKKQRLVETTEAKRLATISIAVTGGLENAVEKRPSKINEQQLIPKHWEERKLSTVMGFRQGKAHEPFMSEEGKYVCVTARFVSTNGVSFRRCDMNLTPARPLDILMVMSDLPNGRALARAYLVRDETNLAVNQRVCALTTKFGDARFFAYQLNRNPQLLRYNDGFNQTHLKNRYFFQLLLRVPPISEQVMIADFLDKSSSALTALTEKTSISIDRLREYRSALITAAVTGQIDPATWSRKGESDRRLDAIAEEMSA